MVCVTSPVLLESHPSLICKFDAEILYKEGVKVSSKSLIWIFKWGLWKAVIWDWLEIKGNKNFFKNPWVYLKHICKTFQSNPRSSVFICLLSCRSQVHTRWHLYTSRCLRVAARHLWGNSGRAKEVALSCREECRERWRQLWTSR